MGKNITVYLVDDDDKITQSLIWLLESVNYKVKSYHSADEFLDKYKEEAPTCLVLDIRMQGMTGLELQEELTKRKIDIPIIFITGHGDIPMSVRAMKQGAVDFLTKPINSQQLLEAVNKAIQSQTTKDKQARKRDALATLVKQLTARENEVMVLMVKGMTTKAIAKKLDLSTNTVEVHRARVLKKMKVDSVAELIHLSLQYQLVN